MHTYTINLHCVEACSATAIQQNVGPTQCKIDIEYGQYGNIAYGEEVSALSAGVVWRSAILYERYSEL